jgi:uncharacterized membrane protein
MMRDMKKENVKTKELSFKRIVMWVLIVGGLIGLFAAFSLTYDEYKELLNPNYRPICSLNPIVSCTDVNNSAQGHIFGFPNMYLGVAAFPILVAVGMALLAGAQFKRWFWLCLNGALFVGALAIHWLFYESVYTIHALCLYCMSIWSVTFPAFWYTTLYNLNEDNIHVSGSLAKASTFVQKHHLDILLIWYVVIAGLILNHFWYYFGKHLF